MSKQQISTDLIIDLLIRDFFGQRELGVCLSSLCLLLSGSYSKIYDLSCDQTTKKILPIGDSVKKIMTHVFSIVLLLNCEFFPCHFGSNISHVQMFKLMFNDSLISQDFSKVRRFRPLSKLKAGIHLQRVLYLPKMIRASEKTLTRDKEWVHSGGHSS